MSTKHKMGGDSVLTNTAGVEFNDGSIQYTAANLQANTMQGGVAVCTGSGPTITFTSAYVGLQAPIVVATGLDGWSGDGLNYSVSLVGTAGAWTGFKLNLSGTFFGAFNWVAFGNPD